MSENSKMKILTNGILNENPVLRLVLGTCPTLAVTTMASNGIGMGLAATFVLLCSNIVISALRNIIPNQVRIPCYITVIAGFVSVVQMVVKAYVPDLDKALGVYLPLIVVNCIILGRAEMFASKNGILDSALDGIGMGGLIPSLGADFAIRVIPEGVDTFSLMTSAPGGFFVFGILMAGATWLTSRPKKSAPVVEGGNA